MSPTSGNGGLTPDQVAEQTMRNTDRILAVRFNLEHHQSRLCRVCQGNGVERRFEGVAPATRAVEHYVKYHATPEEMPGLQRLLDYVAPRDL